MDVPPLNVAILFYSLPMLFQFGALNQYVPKRLPGLPLLDPLEKGFDLLQGFRRKFFFLPWRSIFGGGQG